VIKHIVMWKLKNAKNAERFAELLRSCEGLVPGMVEFEVAVANAKFEANADVLLYSVFLNRSSLNDYQDHPVHQKISAELGAMRDTRMVLDYEVGLTDSVSGPDTLFPETMQGGL
jgi:Stress responsive A/B Barrel Domain